MANKKEPENKLISVQHSNTVWEKPRLHWLKCNVDVAVHSAIASISFGCCIRDSDGHFVMLRYTVQLLPSPYF